MDKSKTLAWLDAICHDALVEARGGNALPANRIGSNPAIAHYLNNVATTGSIKANDWALWYPQYIAEADALRVAGEQAEQVAEQSEQVAEQGDRIAALEAKFDDLAAMLKPFIEAQQQQEAEAEPEKPKRKSRKVKAQEAEGEQEAEPEANDAEDIAEATGGDAADDAADEDEAE